MFTITKPTVLSLSALSLVAGVALAFVHQAQAAAPRHATLAQDASVSPRLDDSIPLPPAASEAILAREVVVEARAARLATRAKAKAWECGAFEPLQNDSVQTVRRCEWR
jgi:hypothetical protein